MKSLLWTLFYLMLSIIDVLIHKHTLLMHFDALNPSRWLSMVVLIGRDVIPFVITSTAIRHEIWMYPTQRTQWHCPQWKTILDMMSLLQRAEPSSEAAFTFHYHSKLFVCSKWKTYTRYLNVFFVRKILWVSLWCSLYFFQLCVYMYLMALFSVYLQHAVFCLPFWFSSIYRGPLIQLRFTPIQCIHTCCFQKTMERSSWPGPPPQTVNTCGSPITSTTQ